MPIANNALKLVRLYTIGIMTMSFMFLTPLAAKERENVNLERCAIDGEVIDQQRGSAINACCLDDGCWVCDAKWRQCNWEPAFGASEFLKRENSAAPGTQRAVQPRENGRDGLSRSSAPRNTSASPRAQTRDHRRRVRDHRNKERERRIARDSIYVSVYPLHGSESDPVQSRRLDDGNINARFQDPGRFPGYLEGPELAVFFWDHPRIATRDNRIRTRDHREETNCASDTHLCGSILISDKIADWHGVRLPHWGATKRQRRGATVYFRLRDMARNYFDKNNRISTKIRDVQRADKLAVLLNRPDSVLLESGDIKSICSASCMRPWNTSKGSRFQIFPEMRPDGRNEGISYNRRPKIFLNRGGAASARVQTHEFGHYYHRVFVPKYGRGGGFGERRTCEEKALDEGLSYWYASDYADRLRPGRRGDWIRNIPRFGDFRRPCKDGVKYDVHHLGDVITNSFWQIRELPGTDEKKWRRLILAQVDSFEPNNFKEYDPYGGRSVVRGFASRVYDLAKRRGVFSDRAAVRACAIMIMHELTPVSTCREK